MQLTGLLERLHKHPEQASSLIEMILGALIIQMVKRTPFYGALLMQLPRVLSTDLNGLMGLAWRRQQIVLLINPNQMIQSSITIEQITALLRQMALHLSFGHPLMYPKQTILSQLACDVVVDQYLGAQTGHLLAKLNYQFQTHWRSQMGSHYYLTQLNQLTGLKSQPAQRGAVDLIHAQSLVGDDHTGWQTFDLAERELQRSRLTQLVQRAFQQTPEKQRGQLPGQVVAAIQPLKRPPQIKNWRQLLQIGMGALPLGQQASRARFNRRQAYRMDLAGQVSNHIRQLNIFIDNSGSMGDLEINELLNEISHLLHQFAPLVSVYSFDTQIHLITHYRATNGAQLKYQRHGGGGTSFQVVFDFLFQQRNKLNDTLTIIMTDGKGEPKINSYGFNNILWILTTPLNTFSLRNQYPGAAITLQIN